MSDTGEFEDSEEITTNNTLAGKKGDDDDDEFEFNAVTQQKPDSGKEEKAELVSNQHFDEALSVSDDESIDDSVSMDQPADNKQQKQNNDDDDDDDEKKLQQHEQEQQQRQQQHQRQVQPDPDDEEEDEGSSDESSSEEDEDEGKHSEAKSYDPADYAHLEVSNEILDLFDYIGRHKPNDIELGTKFRPFIPDFIPAVGDIDAFIKIPPPDGKEDMLGLVVLDEPSSQQSDPTVLDLQLRIISKQSGLKPVTVHSIENADKHPMKITTWINNIEDVHRKKPPPTVNYSKNMPDIETLMQVWPPEFEELLKTCPLPSAEMDMDLSQFSRVVCAILDIPVYEKMTESLHVLLTLYAEFKNHAHFQQ